MKKTILAILAICISISVTAASQEQLIAMRVEVEPLYGVENETTVRVVVSIAPEDRTRLGRQIWVTSELSKGNTEITDYSDSIEVDHQGQARFDAKWPQGTYTLRISIENSAGTARGVWRQPVTIPQMARQAPSTSEPVALEKKSVAAAAPALVPEPAATAPAPLENPTMDQQFPDNRHEVSFLVLDANDQPAGNVDNNAIVLRVNGETVPFPRYFTASTPLNLGLAIDPEVVAGPFADDIRRIVSMFLSYIESTGGRYFVQTPAGGHDWSSSRSPILKELTSSAGGDSPFAPTVSKALASFTSVRGRKALLVIAGEDHLANRDQWKPVFEQVEVSGVPIFVLGVAEQLLEKKTRSRLHKLAELSGGESYMVRDSGTLQITGDLYRAFVTAIYAAEFDATDSPVKIRISVHDGLFTARHSKTVR